LVEVGASLLGQEPGPSSFRARQATWWWRLVEVGASLLGQEPGLGCKAAQLAIGGGVLGLEVCAAELRADPNFAKQN
jgi:hypothetical protein